MSLSTHALRRIGSLQLWLVIPVTFLILLLAALLGSRASPRILALLVILGGVVILLRRPVLSLPTLVITALAVPLEFGTGTDVRINPATVLALATCGLWLLQMILRKDWRLPASTTTTPLVFFCWPACCQSW